MFRGGLGVLESCGPHVERGLGGPRVMRPPCSEGAWGSSSHGPHLQRRQTMALETRERIKPVTGTHIVRVQHEGIVTADAERSKDFYCRVFGWQALERPAFRAGGYWIGTPGIFPQIHIIQTDNVPPGPGAPISPTGRHTAFEVADLEALKATLEREGIKY